MQAPGGQVVLCCFFVLTVGVAVACRLAVAGTRVRERFIGLGSEMCGTLVWVVWRYGGLSRCFGYSAGGAKIGGRWEHWLGAAVCACGFHIQVVYVGNVNAASLTKGVYRVVLVSALYCVCQDIYSKIALFEPMPFVRVTVRVHVFICLVAHRRCCLIFLPAPSSR